MSIEEVLERRRRRYKRALQKMAADPDGRIVLQNLLNESGVLAGSFVSGLEKSTEFVEGRRSIGLEKWAELEELNPAFLSWYVEEKAEFAGQLRREEKDE